MDRTRRHSSCELCALIWRSTMGFYSKSFRFEGGGRQIIGLNRTGKSCRLRWVNYLHPGLKRGKMTQQEERLVLELHSKWGNRWSRIARKLPGRTDNEIKNYWRTHMRKKAQERKRSIINTNNNKNNDISPSSSSSNSCSSSTVTTAEKASFYDTGGVLDVTGAGKQVEEGQENGYSMDDIWKDIELSEENCSIQPQPAGNFSCANNNNSMVSPTWDYCWDSIWKMEEEEESKMMINNLATTTTDQFQYGFFNRVG